MKTSFLVLFSLAVYCSIFTICNAQIGTDCSSIKSCMLDQSCFAGYCVCNRGFVKNVRQCFPVRKHGQMCFVAAQCVDHRMTCARENPGDDVMKCICDQYHTWHEEGDVCVQSMNTTTMLETLKEKYDHEGRISREAETVFLGAIVAGSLVICLGAIFIIGCLSYVCCSLGRKKIVIDAPEKFSLIDPESQKPKKSTPSSAKATGLVGVDVCYLQNLEATRADAAATNAAASGSAAEPLLQDAELSAVSQNSDQYVAAGTFDTIN